MSLVWGSWVVFDRAAFLADITILDVVEFWPQRFLALIFIVVFFHALIVRLHASEDTARGSKYHLFNLFTLVLTVVLLFLYTAPGLILVAALAATAFLGFVQVNRTVAITTAVTFTGGISFAYFIATTTSLQAALATVAPLVVLGTVAVKYLDVRGHYVSARMILTAAFPIAWIIVAFLMPPSANPAVQTATAVFLFLGFFPLVNAAFDTVSYAMTIALMNRGLRSGHVPGLPFFLGLADLVFALILFALLASALLVLLDLLSLISPAMIFDVTSMMDQIRSGQGDFLWLFAMLFSTIVPTLTHALVAIMGLQSIVPLRFRKIVADILSEAPGSQLKATVGPFLGGLVLLIPIVAIGVLAYLTASLVGPATSAVFSGYFRVLENLLSFMS